MVNNGTIGWNKVVDFGAFLALQVEKDKWMAWAKGKPLLVKGGFKKRYTYLLTPEIAWTLDGDSIVSIMAKAKALAYPQFKGRENSIPKELPDGKVDLQPEKPLTREEVIALVDAQTNKLQSAVHNEIMLALQSLKQETTPQPEQQIEPPKAPEPVTPPEEKKSEPEQNAPSVPVQPAPPAPSPQAKIRSPAGVG